MYGDNRRCVRLGGRAGAIVPGGEVHVPGRRVHGGSAPEAPPFTAVRNDLEGVLHRARGRVEPVELALYEWTIIGRRRTDVDASVVEDRRAPDRARGRRAQARLPHDCSCGSVEGIELTISPADKDRLSSTDRCHRGRRENAVRTAT